LASGLVDRSYLTPATVDEAPLERALA
jgi:hypothetical protein